MPGDGKQDVGRDHAGRQDGDARPRFPDAPMLLAFKGMALLRMGLVSDAQAPLLAAANQTADTAAANLAKDLLTWTP